MTLGSFRVLSAFAFAAVFSVTGFQPAPAAAALAVTRATLANGLKIIVVRDPLAPVVTAVLNYKVGSSNQKYAGQAHALEHMMFRGSKTISESQLADIGELMGGNANADTQSELTQYFYSAPSQYLDVALRLEASRARGALLPQNLWNIERGAIMNEVTQDDSIAIQKLFRRTITPSIFAGTPYANDGLGTLKSFKTQINSPQLMALYNAWYHPNNAVYVIAGDVDGPATVKAVAKYFGSIPAAKLPAQPKVVLSPVKAATYHVDSDQPYDIIVRAYRLPGYKSPDYAASEILESVLGNQRANLFGLAASGKALAAGFSTVDSHPLASAAIAYSIVPVTAKPDAALADITGVIDGYVKTGVPADLVAVAKQRAIANAEFRGNSVDGLAFAWSEAVAKEGLNSPDDELTAIKGVTVADVNRVLRKYLIAQNSITAFAIPKNLGKVNTNAPSGPAKESNKITITHHDPLPSWAIAAFKNVQVPKPTIDPVVSILPNGIRLIVQPEHVTHTVIVRGSVQSNEAIQAAPDKLGVGDITAGLFPYGTATYDRIALREQLDKIAAEVSAGTDFTLDVLSNQFDRGMQILAEEQLHPAFPETAFATVKQQEVGALTGQATAPDHLTEVALNKALYPADDPTQRFATATTAGAVTLPDVKSYYASVYRPDLTTIVVIGDTTPAAALALVEKYFGGWTATGTKPDVFLPAVPPNKAADINIPAQGRVQSDVHLAQVNALGRGDPDWATLALANAVLGRGETSMLYHDVRDVHGYVYSIYSRLDSHRNRSTFEIGFASDPNKVNPAQHLALADLQQIGSTPIEAGTLQRAKAMMIAAIPLRMTSFDAVASQLINFAELGLPLDQPTIDARRELGASAPAVRAAVKKWIRPNDFVRIIQGPPPK